MDEKIKALEEDRLMLSSALTDLQLAYNNEMVDLKKAKELLKSAIDEWNINCEFGNCGNHCVWYDAGKCTQVWSRKDEALKLIGSEKQ